MVYSSTQPYSSPNTKCFAVWQTLRKVSDPVFHCDLPVAAPLCHTVCPTAELPQSENNVKRPSSAASLWQHLY